MNERSIQILLMQEFLIGRNHVAAVPNSTQLLHGEVDLLSVTKAGLVHEFEIKRTRSDYNREFKTKRSKHWFLKNGTYLTYVPNYYWFVTLEFEIEPPPYAGWICVKNAKDRMWYSSESETHYLDEVKQAPRIHSSKWDDKAIARIARLLSFRLLKEYENRRDETINEI